LERCAPATRRNSRTPACAARRLRTRALLPRAPLRPRSTHFASRVEGGRWRRTRSRAAKALANGGRRGGGYPARARDLAMGFVGTTFLFILLEVAFVCFVNWFFKAGQRQCVPPSQPPSPPRALARARALPVRRAAPPRPARRHASSPRFAVLGLIPPYRLASRARTKHSSSPPLPSGCNTSSSAPPCSAAG